MRDPHIDKIISDLKFKKFQDGEAKKLTDTYGAEISKQIGPLFEAHSKTITDALGKAIQAPTVNIPETKFPDQQAPVVNVPAPIVNIPAPIVNVPAPVINIPENKYPEPLPFPTSFKLDGIDKMRPMPVMMVDDKGKPAQFHFGGGATGGKSDFFTILGIQNTIGVVTINPDGSPTYTSASGSSGGSTQSIDSSGLPYSQANPLPVVFGSSGTSASMIVDSTGVAYSGSNPLPTTASVSITLPSGPGDGATATRFIQAGDSVSSTNILQFNGNTPATGLNETTGGVLRTVLMTDSVSSVNVVSSVALTITSVTNTIATALVDSSGVQYSGSNPFIVDSNDALGQGDTATAIRIVHAGDSATSVNVVSSAALTVTSITNSVAASLVDSSNVQYSGSNPLPITLVSGALTSTVVVGDSAARTADNAGNPVKVGGIARTTNPTAYADGDRSNLGTDKLGRTLTRPLQVRDLVKTAYATLSTGTETTLLAGVAGAFLDPILITATNTSSAAVQVDLRAVTAGNIVMTWMIPATTGPIGLTLPVGWPQDATGNNWTVDMGDFTNTTLYFSALFTQEI